MEASTVFAAAGFMSAFASAFLLSKPLARDVQKRAAATRMQQASFQKGFFASLVRNGVPWLKPLARFLLANKHIKAGIVHGKSILHLKGLVTTAENLCSLCCVCLIVAGASLGIIGGSLLFALVGSACIVVAAVFFLAREREKQAYELRDAIPDALRSMSVCFGVGFSLLQTFHQVAQEVDGPLRDLFLQAVNELETGQTASEALAVFKKSQVNELAFIAVALDIQHKVGGSMQQVLDSARESVESEIELSRSLKVQTAQAKMSARVVSSMPLILVALFSFISQDFLAPFFQSALGLILLGVAISMQIGGILLVRKTLRVEVG